MVTTRSTPVVCPNCHESGATIVLGQRGSSVIVECHACLTLQIASFLSSHAAWSIPADPHAGTDMTDHPSDEAH